MKDLIDEIQALRRIGHVRLPSPRVAAARVRLRRKLRLAGVIPAYNAPTWGLAALLRLPAVRERLGRAP